MQLVKAINFILILGINHTDVISTIFINGHLYSYSYSTIYFIYTLTSSYLQINIIPMIKYFKMFINVV